MTHLSDREERERYMDSIERQMEHQREQIQRTLDRTTEGSDRRRRALEKLWSSLPAFPSRTPARDTEEREKRAREPSVLRPWWRRMLGG